MKKLLTLIAVLNCVFVFGQAPNLVNYQGIARNAVGNVLPNKKITLRLSIRDQQPTGTVVYSETREVTTSNIGMFNIAIGGEGTSSKTGNMGNVDWGSGSKYLQVEIDPEGGSGFTSLGAVQLLSVPYALYAAKTSNTNPTGPAGGSLTGTYPEPTIKNGAVTQQMLASGLTLPPSGTAGGALAGSYPNPTIKNGAVTNAALADNSVTATKIADGSVTTGKIVDGSITTGKIADGSVTTTKIADVSVSNIKLQDGSVSTTKLADGSVSTIKLQDGAVTTPIIADGSVTNPKIADGSVATSKIQDGAVNTLKIADGSVNTIKIADGSVTNPKIADGAVATVKIQDGAVTTVKLADKSVSTNKISDNAITSTQLADNSVGTSEIVNGSVTANKLAAGVIPSSLPPSGAAGGDLTLTYPNPAIATGAVNSAKLADNAVTGIKIADGAVVNTKIADNSISTNKIINGSVTGVKIADNAVVSTKIADNAVITAKIADNAVTNPKIADNSISTSKVQDGSITMAKLGPDVVFGGGGGGTPSGSAGGDLSGNYPNPSLASGSVTSPKIANGAILSPKIADGAVNSGKLADNSVITTKITDLAVTSAKINDGAVGTSKIADNSITTPKIVDLAVTTPKIADASIISTKIADGSILTSKIADNNITTSKILDGAVTASKLAPGVIPTALPPMGAASGDLSGTYPAPTVARIQGVPVSTTAPAAGQVLKFNGTAWLPSTDNEGVSSTFTLPYVQSQNHTSALFSLTNPSGMAIEGINGSASDNSVGILGRISNATAGIAASGVKGEVLSTGYQGAGVYGLHNGYGSGVVGYSGEGTGMTGLSDNGNAIFGTSNNGISGYFDISNTNSYSDALFSYSMGYGSAMTGIGEQGNGVWGITSNQWSAGLLGYNMGGGEAVVGRNFSPTSAAVVGRNDDVFAGVQGIAGFEGGIGVLATANVEGYNNGTALVASLEAGTGNTAVFKSNGSNVARIDHLGTGYFNNGTVVGGADVAEYFEVEGSRNTYEPGDVLVISQHSDRTVEKSGQAYSTLVAGVYATKPGLMLTERNASQQSLDDLVPMGVIGVIPTKVCLEGGPIKRGDLIVTSSTPGVAMKADPDKVRVGQVIGKALQDFNSTQTGKINVLVSIK